MKRMSDVGRSESNSHTEKIHTRILKFSIQCNLRNSFSTEFHREDVGSSLDKHNMQATTTCENTKTGCLGSGKASFKLYPKMT